MTTLNDYLRMVPPQNLEAESSTIGAVFLEPDCINEILQTIGVKDFYRGSHQTIFRAMVDLHEAGTEIDLITLSEFLKSRNELESVGGSAYLAGLVDFTPSAANVRHYARIVKEKSQLRCVISLMQEGLTRGYEEQGSPSGFTSELAAKLAALQNGNGNGQETIWSKAKDAPTLLAEADKDIQGLAKDLIIPEAITMIAAPRGLGKTLVAHGVAITLARGGDFRNESVKPMRVLLVDRDNPKHVVKSRLRNFGGADAANLKILTREDAPDLRDKNAWESFPVADYDVIMIDSLGSFTEGVTEKEGKETTEILATVLDLIHRGPAVLLLANCTKDALNVKGRGEWMDRVDVVYEVRDATGFVPSGKKDWWMELPAAGEDAWADRASRRKNRIDYRLAFIPSKFRLGAQPDPFCLEIDVPSDATWTLSDVTNDLIEAGENVIKETAKKKEEQEKAAVDALVEVIQTRYQEQNPILKTEAETYLNKEMEVPRKRSRELIAANKGVRWTFGEAGGKSHGKTLLPYIDIVAATETSRGILLSDADLGG